MTERAQIGIVALVGLMIGAIAAMTTVTQGASSSTEVNLIAHSAETATNAGSARADYRMEITMGSGGPAMGLTGDASFDFTAQAFAMTMDLDAPGTGGFRTEMRFVDGVMYMRMPTDLGAPTPWISLDIAAVAGEDVLAELTAGSDVTQTLHYLRGAGEVNEVGREEVRGVPTTHYRADVDLGRAADLMPGDQRAQFEAAVEQFEAMAGRTSMPVDVWIDDAGLPRRMNYRIEMDGSAFSDQLPGDGSLAMSFSMDVYDYGELVSVGPPPPHLVTDMTSDVGQLSDTQLF